MAIYNQYKIINEIFYILLYVKNPMCSLHLEHISVLIRHILNAQQPHVASDYCIGRARSILSLKGSQCD